MAKKKHVDDKDLDLRSLVLEHCDKMGDVDIKALLEKHLPKLDGESSFMQKTLLNRFFSNLMFKFRSDNEVKVIDVLPFLIREGTNGDWFACYIKFVYPFLKEHNAFAGLEQ